MSTKWTKMSKSEGNGISPEEVVKGVCVLDPGYEFRDLTGNLIDWETQGVWFDESTGYRTSTKYQRQPVFMHVTGNPVPAWLTTLGKSQHEDEESFWIGLLRKYDRNRTGLEVETNHFDKPL